MNAFLMRREKTGRERRKPCKDRGRDWSDVVVSQGMSRTAGHHQKLVEKCGTFSLRASTGNQPADFFISDF